MMNFEQAADYLTEDQNTKNEIKLLHNKLLDKTYVSNLRLDFHRPEVYSETKENFQFFFRSELYEKIMNENNSFALYSIFMSVFNICLSKLTGASNVIVGSPSLKKNQDNPTLQNIIPVVNEIKTEISFQQFSYLTFQNLKDCYKHQNYPFEDLVKALNLSKVTNRCPLVDIILLYNDIHNNLPNIKNDITIEIKHEFKKLYLNIHFNLSLFRRDSIDHLAKTFENILSTVLENSNVQVASLLDLTNSEKQVILVEWNNTIAPYPKNKCIHEIFEVQVLRNPKSIAVVCDNTQLTYEELDKKANQLANHLQKLGIACNTMVGIFVDRSLEMIIGILGVLKAGGTYIPIDTGYPKKRIEAMLEDTKQLKLLLTKKELVHQLPETNKRILFLDEDWKDIAQEGWKKPKSDVSPDNIVYVVFTSGSTGRPKGGAVFHKGWTNLLNWFKVEFGLNEIDKCLVISAFGFDITQRSLLMPLMSGGELHLFSPQMYDPDLIIQNIRENKITILNCSPSTFYPLIESEKLHSFQELQSLRQIFLGGEEISASRLKAWAESDYCEAEVVNVYGVAECTDVSSFYYLSNYDQYVKSSVLAGKPIYNTSIYIVNEDLNPLPIGVVGEICIAGEGIGAGYINDEKLNVEKYVDDPFSKKKGTQMYKTGDLGRYLPEGDIEFCGRVDRQIKLRGFRIELGEIESTLRQFPKVKEAVVVDWEFSLGDVRLISYIVVQPEYGALSEKLDSISHDPEKHGTLIDRLRIFAKKKLPDYMVPNVFMVLEKMPLSPNGKLDRNALPKPEISDVKIREESLDYTTPIEKTLFHIFLEALKIDRLSRDDDFFFDLGGYSLLATQVITEINQEFGSNLSQMMFFEEPTVAGIAEIIESKLK